MSHNLTMKELPDLERPDEKCINKGTSSLSDAELLAAIIRTGLPGERSTEVAHRILNAGPDGLLNLIHMDFESLIKIRGIGKVKAVQLKCIGELARRIASANRHDMPVFSDPSVVVAYYMESLRHCSREHLHAALLDTKNHLKKDVELSIGTANMALIDPSEVFRSALKYNAQYVILVHNHPSGDPSPSSADSDVTTRIQKCGDLLGIPLLDHIIIGDNRYHSFKQAGDLGRKGV